MSGDVKFLDIKGTSAYGTMRGFKDASPSEISGEPGAVIHPGRWDNSPKPASSVAFVTELRRKQYLPYVYIGKETVDTGFASIECAVYEAKSPDGGTMKYWFNPRIGNSIKAITTTGGVTTIAYLKETNILSKQKSGAPLGSPAYPHCPQNFRATKKLKRLSLPRGIPSQSVSQCK